MAKKKTAKKPAAKKATTEKKTPEKKAAAKKEPKAAAPALTTDAIGHAAGAVWGALHSEGPLTLAALKKASGASGDATLMAVGWLAREGKLDFTVSGRSVKVSLR